MRNFNFSEEFSFQFSLKTGVRFGLGCRSFLPETIRRNHWRKVGVIVDHNLFPLLIFQKLIDDIQAGCERSVIVPCTIQEPTYDTLETARKDFEEAGLQVVIGIGGGSVLDMAKGMAVLAHNRKPAIEYRGFDRMTEPVLPIIAVPTTAGTGSEVTPNASFIDAEKKIKLGINGEAVRPLYAFLDPELTLSCPPKPTLSAGVDSLVHATEAFVAKKSNSLARFFAREGFGLVFQNLPKLMQEPNHLDYRTRVMYGAFLSGIALMHSGTGPAAALSYPLGVHYKIPHGIAGAIFLPYVVQYNVEHGVCDYAEMLSENCGEIPNAPQEKARHFVSQMFATWKSLGIPQKLANLSPEISKELLIKDALQLKMALEQNPVEFNEKELRETLAHA